MLWYDDFRKKYALHKSGGDVLTVKKPVIVLTSQAMPMEEPFRQDYHYSNAFNTDAIVRAGGLPVLPPYLEKDDALELLSSADGLFMTGGANVSPKMYGQEKLPCCGKTDPVRDKYDCNLLDAALKLKKPVLCICRGFQIANVRFGGTLYQDLPFQRPSQIQHSQYDSYGKACAHEVKILENTPLYRLLGRTEIMVNSLHRQAVKELAPDFKPMAYAPDGVLEGWYLPDDSQWLHGIQWHPEMMNENPDSDAVFAEFINVCGGCSRKHP